MMEWLKKFWKTEVELGVSMVIDTDPNYRWYTEFMGYGRSIFTLSESDVKLFEAHLDQFSSYKDFELSCIAKNLPVCLYEYGSIRFHNPHETQAFLALQGGIHETEFVKEPVIALCKLMETDPERFEIKADAILLNGEVILHGGGKYTQYNTENESLTIQEAMVVYHYVQNLSTAMKISRKASERDALTKAVMK